MWVLAGPQTSLCLSFFKGCLERLDELKYVKYLEQGPALRYDSCLLSPSTPLCGNWVWMSDCSHPDTGNFQTRLQGAVREAMVNLQCCCEGHSGTAPWHMNVMLIVSQKATVQPVGLVFVCRRPAFVLLLKHTYKQTNKQKAHTAKHFYWEVRHTFWQIRTVKLQHSHFSKPAEFVTGLGVLYGKGFPKWFSGLCYLLASCGRGRQRSGQVTSEWNWISE